MNTIEFFNKHKYVHLIDFLPKFSCDELTNELKKLIAENKTFQDPQCPKSQAVYGEKIFDKLLEQCLPYFEKACGLELLPTYSFARLYAPNEELLNHIDRSSCEISATITLGFDGDGWAIYMGDDENKSNASKIDMNIGDAVLYKGMEKWHWREPYVEGKWQAQVFLHYVDKNGKHAEWKYDKRDCLGVKKTIDSKPNNDSGLDVCYTIPNLISEQFCNNIVVQYSKDEVEKELPYIGDGQVDYNVRNVKRLMLPMNVGIGGTLTAAGLNTNHDFWKFDVTHSNQTEFLMYEVGGKYEEHIDTFFEHSTETRKITVIAILNDDFEGGRFFIKNGLNKIYPKQNKGDVIVFPSFLIHGVEPITKGKRFAAVTWLVGNFFK